ncbi:HMG (high mobility group) box protein [Rhizoctonia solani 123E]|uniref:HMG (High mobility group) box protein n=1 Tax=Rhizoctonia solani 123E TaxID=1423351 RepID=A0A074SST4_9AGAM|nr:HMG (high mobility group) box protein [Rhizoctonia solani 123E]
MHRTKPPPMEMGHIANQINAMPVAPAAEAQKREIVAKLNDLAAQMKAWAAQVEGFASHLDTLSVQSQKYPTSPSESRHSSRGAPNGQPYNAYTVQQYNGSQQYQFQTPYHQYSPSARPQSADYPGAQLSKVSPVPPGPGSATPAPVESEKTGKRRRRTDSTRKKKDPLAPKRPPSAYILYQNDVRKQMQDKYPGLPYPDVLGKISESWQTLEESRKKVYLDMVERDKLRYEDEKTRYNAGQDIPTKPIPRRPLSSLRAPQDLDPDADAEVEPEGDEEEEPEEEQEEQSQPDAKRSKLGSAGEAQPERLVGQRPGSRSESQSSKASHQSGYPDSQHTPQTPASALHQSHQVGFPELVPQNSYPQHATAPQHASYPNSSLPPQLSPQTEHATLHAVRTTATSQPQGVHPAHTSPQAAHVTFPMARPLIMHTSPGVSHPSLSPQLAPPSLNGTHTSPQATNTGPQTTYPSPRHVYMSPGQAHPQPPQSQNSNPSSTMQMSHSTRVPPSEMSTPSGPGT